MTIIDAIYSREISVPLFKDPRTWHAWEVYLRGLFGLLIANKKDLALFKECAGLE